MNVTQPLDSKLIDELAYDANDNPEYMGWSAPGHGTDEPEWKIKKFIFDANGKYLRSRWADGNDAFDKVWDNRATYTY